VRIAARCWSLIGAVLPCDSPQGHPCYNASKDLVVPAFKGPSMWGKSPYLQELLRKHSSSGATQKKARDILAFFR
jgi:hypothetical protein